MDENVERKNAGTKIAVTAIIVGGLVTFACIAGLVGVAMVFFMNPPW